MFPARCCGNDARATDLLALVVTTLALALGGCIPHAFVPSQQSLDLAVHERASHTPVTNAVITVAPLPRPPDVVSTSQYLDRIAAGGTNQAVTDARGYAVLTVNTTAYKGFFDGNSRKNLRGRPYVIRVHTDSAEDVLETAINIGDTICGDSFCVTVRAVGSPAPLAASPDTRATWEATASEEARAIEVARREVNAREDWAEDASYRVLQRPGLDELWVLVRRNRTSGPQRESSRDERVDRIVRTDSKGNMIEYRSR
jgi:hypothetical protein